MRRLNFIISKAGQTPCLFFIHLKAAFDLEHAAQTGNNPTYYNTGSPYYTGKNSSQSSTDEVDPSASASTAMVVDGKLQGLIRGGLMGDDFLINAAMILSEYYEKMTSEDVDALASKYGIDPNKL